MEDAGPQETVPAESAPAAMLAPTAALSGEPLAGSVQDPQSRAENSESALERYGLRVGDLHFLAGRHAARETLDPPPVYPLPHTPAWLKGLANVRGNIVPVIDLAVAAGTNHVSALKPYLVVFGQTEESMALLVDGLPKVLTLEAAERLASPPAVASELQEFVTAAYDHEGLVWLELDFARLFEAFSRRLARAS
ncbi:MAG: hypothetical protein A2151_03310 [Candidatus Muproteobacteria bacterium RBG_16_65_34]|uniref:CheW-like domain-containing protein n=1 Tax=Candidatus Muproteobacteria bacterium RBG_16_65_34 TaxID=1817760 RepID=A0A1F6TRW7_9PROT|nr:MAG: hypothetical protein A2151_03310 [Candidatus Muproteobacteria bacterium RBG_16_65_34]